MERQKVYRTTRIVITKHHYGRPCMNDLGTSYSADAVECIVEVNGEQVYTVRQSWPVYLESEPGLFEQWLTTGRRLFKQSERRYDRRSDVRKFPGLFKLAWRKVFGKFVNFKS